MRPRFHLNLFRTGINTWCFAMEGLRVKRNENIPLTVFDVMLLHWYIVIYPCLSSFHVMNIYKEASFDIFFGVKFKM